MVNKAIAGVGSLAIVGGAVLAALVTVMENFVIVELKGTVQCTEDGGTPLGTLGVLTASFNPSCTAGTPAEATYGIFEDIESGDTKEFWPLFPSQTGFGGILGTDFEFTGCENIFSDAKVQSTMVKTLVVPRLLGNYFELEAVVNEAYENISIGVYNLVEGGIDVLFNNDFRDTSIEVLFNVSGAFTTVSSSLSPTFGQATAAQLQGAIAGGGLSDEQVNALLLTIGLIQGCSSDPSTTTVVEIFDQVIPTLDVDEPVGSSLCPLKVVATQNVQLQGFVNLVEDACNATQTYRDCAADPKGDYNNIPEDLTGNWDLCPILVGNGILPPTNGTCSALYVLSYAEELLKVLSDGEPVPVSSEEIGRIGNLLGYCGAVGILLEDCIGARGQPLSGLPVSYTSDFRLARTFGPGFGTFADFVALQSENANLQQAFQVFTPCSNLNAFDSAVSCQAAYNSVLDAYSAGLTPPEFTPLATGLANQAFANFLDGQNSTGFILACEDDVKDSEAIEQAQTLMPIAIGALAVGALAGFATMLTGKRSIGIIGAVVAVVGVALVLVSLLGVRSAPVYASVGQPVEDGEAEYLNGIGSSVFALVAIGASALGAILLLASSFCNNSEEDDENALTSKVDNTY